MSCTVARRANIRRTSDSPEAGFSTLEALFAIGILAIALLPLYEFQLTIVDGARRLEGQFDKTRMRQEVDAYLGGLQPSGLAGGEGQIGPVSLTWTVEQTANVRPILNNDGLSGRFALGLVTIQYRADTGEGEVLKGELTRLSWKETAPFFSP